MARKKCGHYSGIGGQAVLEGVMMKNKEKYAVAVRKPNGEIEVKVETHKGLLEGSKPFSPQPAGFSAIIAAVFRRCPCPQLQPYRPQPFRQLHV